MHYFSIDRQYKFILNLMESKKQSPDVKIPYDTIKKHLGIDANVWDVYRGALSHIESGGNYSVFGGAGDHYDGRYQLGRLAKIDAANFLGIPDPGHSTNPNDPRRKQFRANQQMQEDMLAGYTIKNHGYLMDKKRGCKGYQCLPIEKQLEVLAYAHNQGWAGAKEWVETGEVGTDAFGTKGTEYSEKFASDLKAYNQTAPQTKPQTPPQTPPPQTENVPEPQVGSGAYKVQEGDVLGVIAQKLSKERGYKITVDDLAKLNQIPNPNKISIGQELKIPENPNAQKQTATAQAAPKQELPAKQEPKQTKTPEETITMSKQELADMMKQAEDKAVQNAFDVETQAKEARESKKSAGMIDKVRAERERLEAEKKKAQENKTKGK